MYSNQDDATQTVSIRILDIDRGLRKEPNLCRFEVHNFKQSGRPKTKWGAYSCKANGKNLKTYCLTCRITCEKDWREGTEGWHTKLHLETEWLPLASFGAADQHVLVRTRVSA